MLLLVGRSSIYVTSGRKEQNSFRFPGPKHRPSLARAGEVGREGEGATCTRPIFARRQWQRAGRGTGRRDGRGRGRGSPKQRRATAAAAKISLVRSFALGAATTLRRSSARVRSALLGSPMGRAEIQAEMIPDRKRRFGPYQFG